MLDSIDVKVFSATDEGHYPLAHPRNAVADATAKALQWIMQNLNESHAIQVTTAVCPIINFTGYEATVSVFFWKK